jgi:isoleucyl-tRNA synthetase
LVTIAKLAAPIAPFFTDRLFQDLNAVSGKESVDSIHLSSFPEADETLIDKSLEERMQMAQQISSMVLSLRKKHNLRVRQPLQKIMIPVLETAHFKPQIERVKDLILSEVNVKNLEFLEETEGILVKKIKPNFKTLGPKYGKIMKAIASKIAEFSSKDITEIEKNGRYLLNIDGEEVILEITDVEITAEDIPGWVVAAQGALTVALDTTVTEALLFEAYARELINRIQNYRKDAQMDVVDKIVLTLQKHPQLDTAFKTYQDYICNETLCKTLNFTDTINSDQKTTVEIVDGLSIDILVEKAE